ncbi:MAG: cytochrome c3 family protein [Eggerthellaceae bacterium]|nr:cytochrome c3 family protein [Eggerthellaceae bacterium]MDR2716137.1 cytochrome c3 family protein [Coriobacteriaceae bacterium]
MKIRSKRMRVLIGACFAVAVMLLALAACQPGPGNTAGESIVSPLGGDTAVKGDYDQFNPEVDAAETGGEEIKGSEEDELQQERIAGGSVGGVVSKNLEPLYGITETPGDEFRLAFGMNLQAPPMGHTGNGPDCMSCHRDGGSGAVQPRSHVDAQLTNEDCVTCHVEPVG